MKHLSWKARQHHLIRRRTEEFLARGGRIREVPPGTSGLREGQPVPAFRTFSPATLSRRTPLTEVVASIEARKKSRKNRHARGPARSTGPRRKLIRDDFGEPLRWVWVDE